MSSDWSTGVVEASSLEEFKQAFSRVWDLDYEQLAGGLLNAKIRYLRSPGLLAYWEQLDRPLRMRGSLGDSSVAFALPRRHGYSFRLHGREIAPRCVPWLGLGAELDLVSDAEFDNVVLIFDPGFLHQIADRLRHPLANESLAAPSASIFPSTPCDAAGLRREIVRLLRGVETRPAGRMIKEAKDCRLDERIAEDFLDSLEVDSKDYLEHSENLTTGQGYELAQTIMEYARARDYNVTIAELCDRVGKSRRTVERVFRESTDVSPARYLFLCRMQRAHGDLMSARSRELTVTEVAMRWGFCQLGRFAGAYRQLFEELPSDTLQRSLRRLTRIPNPDLARPSVP